VPNRLAPGATNARKSVGADENKERFETKLKKVAKSEAVTTAS
jgi:hypothetical protein